MKSALRLLVPVLTALFCLFPGSGAGNTAAGRIEPGPAAPATSAGIPPTASPEISARLQGLLDSLALEEPDVRGGVLLVSGPRYHWKGATGMADPDRGLAMLPDDSFNTDSIAKLFTAVVVMLLVEQGELGLDDPVSRYLPDSLVSGLHLYRGISYGEKITVRHLLSHRSGIPDDWADPAFLDLIVQDPERRWRPEETVQYVKEHCPARFAPGSGFLYSDVGYNLLGLIIENVTGHPLHQVQRDLLFEPLGMRHTYRPSHESARPGIPGRGPSKRYLGDLECSAMPAVLTADWAGGGLVSTVEDLNRFLRAFVRGEIFADPKSRDRMLAWQNSGPYHEYGLGISRVNFERSGQPGHAGLGELWGHRGTSQNYLFYWPERDIVLTGTMNQIACRGDLYGMLAQILRALPAGR